MEENKKKYEITFLTRQENERLAVSSLLKKRGAEIVAENNPSRIKLSFPIKKENFAFLNTIIFEGDVELALGLSNELKTDGAILRFSILNAPEAKPLISEMSAGQVVDEGEEAVQASVPEDTEEDKKTVLTKPVDEKQNEGRFEGELSNEALEKKLEELLGE